MNGDFLVLLTPSLDKSTHEQNLAMGQAIRRVLARSFKVTMTDESALIVGKLPKTLRVKKLKDLANPGVFKGGNVVFVSPDEVVQELRLRFSGRVKIWTA